MIINPLWSWSKPGSFTFIPRDVSFRVPLLFTAGLGACATMPELASNWPLPTLSMHAPCPRRTGIVAIKQLRSRICIVYHCWHSLLFLCPLRCLLQFVSLYQNLIGQYCCQYFLLMFYILADRFSFTRCDRIVKSFHSLSCDRSFSDFFSFRLPGRKSTFPYQNLLWIYCCQLFLGLFIVPRNRCGVVDIGRIGFLSI